MLILLYKGVSLISRVIRWRTWSDYSHAAIMPASGWRQTGSIKDSMLRGNLYEAWYARDAKGVTQRTGIHVGHTPGTVIDVYEVADPFIDVASVERFLTEQLGKGYDFRGVLGFVSRRDGANAHDRWFCSELVFAACLHGGLALLSRIEPHRVDPGLLALSPHLTFLGSTKTGTLDWTPAEFLFDPAKAAQSPYTAPSDARRPETAASPRPALVHAFAALAAACRGGATLAGDGSGRCLPDFDPFNPQKEMFA